MRFPLRARRALPGWLSLPTSDRESVGPFLGFYLLPKSVQII